MRGLICFAVSIGLLGASPNTWAGGPKQIRQLTKSLKSKSFKVRLSAAIQIGKRKAKDALPALRKATDDQSEHPAVRAAALGSMAQLGDEASRRRMAYLIAHKNSLIAKAAEKALMALDAAMERTPYYLVSIAAPRLPPKTPKALAKILMQALHRKVANTGGLVIGAGEEKFLSDEAFTAHLARRDLTGLLIKPVLAKLSAEVEGGQTTVVAVVRLVQFSLPGKQREFSAEGGADAWIEAERLTKRERQELETEVIEGAADSALMQLLNDLQERAQ
jgi:hypothetical protein